MTQQCHWLTKGRIILHPSPVRNPLTQPNYEFEPLVTHCPDAGSNSKAGLRRLVERRNAGGSLALRGPLTIRLVWPEWVVQLGRSISTGGECRLEDSGRGGSPSGFGGYEQPGVSEKDAARGVDVGSTGTWGGVVWGVMVAGATRPSGILQGYLPF